MKPEGSICWNSNKISAGCDSSLLGFAEEDSFPHDAWLECSFSAVLLGAPSTGRKWSKLLLLFYPSALDGGKEGAGPPV